MTLRAYYGELLLVPYPLELSIIEPCDYACSYCFAILGDRARHFSKTDAQKENAKAREANGINSTIKLLSNSWRRKTLDAKLFNASYPVLISNRTDPFGRKNRKPTIALLELFNEMEKPVAFQTKGFIKHDEDFETVMELIKPSHWYISISFNDDNIRKRVEPGSTPIEYRWELAKELKRRGHVVSIGWNPFCPDWFGWRKGGELMIEKMIEAGVDACAIQPLHVNYHWIMTEKEKQLFHGGDMDFWNKVAGKKTPPSEWTELFEDMHNLAYESGINMIGHHYGAPQDTWGSTHALYPRSYPTIADFAWHCHLNKLPGESVTFDEWYDWIKSWGVIDGQYPLGSAISLKTWRLCRKITNSMGWDKFQTKMNWRSFLETSWLWMDKLSFFTPLSHNAFCLMRDNGNLVIDSNGLPVLAYAPIEGNYFEQRAGCELQVTI